MNIMEKSKLMKRLFIRNILPVLMSCLFITSSNSLKVVAPREVGVVDGEKAFLPCIFTLDDKSVPINISRLEVEWTNGPTILTYKNGRIEPYSEKACKGHAMMNEQNLRNGDATLILSNTNPFEDTLFVCDVTYNDETDWGVVKLKPKVLVHCPEFIVAPPVKESTVMCNFSLGSRGIPPSFDPSYLSIRWYKDSNKSSFARFTKGQEHHMDGVSMSVSEVRPDTFSLTLKSVKPDDYGYYTCKVNYPRCFPGYAVTALYMGSGEKRQECIASQESFAGWTISDVVGWLLILGVGMLLLNVPTEMKEMERNEQLQRKQRRSNTKNKKIVEVKTKEEEKNNNEDDPIF
uniref:Ig-like domain-containing protein n=1 Tax=Eptatretus burgeri TaxID=7764 RepID=A0A8C4Q1K4_EPTBU